MKIMNYCLALLLVVQAPAHAESKTFEKVALGALAGIGTVAAGCLAWNSSYYSAESTINSAQAHEKSERALYSHVLASRTSNGLLMQEIARMHRASTTYGLRGSYPLLWFVDRLNLSIQTLKEKQARVASYARDMRKHPDYYQHLVSERSCIEIATEALLSQLTLLLADVTQMPDYWNQQRDYQHAQERQQLEAFRARVHNARYEISGIASEFARELDQLNTVALASDFASLVYTIVTANYSVSVHGSTLRYSYPALWYEERLCKTIRKIEGIHSNLHSEHVHVAMLSLYRLDATADSEYMRLMHDVNHQLLRLRDIRDRLPLTYFYIADLRAYEQACRDQVLYQREQQARERERQAAQRERDAYQREREAREREYQAQQREREAYQQECDARERERVAAQRERDAREARERAERERLAAAAPVPATVAGQQYFPLDL